MRTLLAICLALSPALADAAVERQAPASRDPAADQRLVDAGLGTYFVELDFRLQGVDAYRKREYPRALRLLERAAWYGDKPAQALIGEMHFNGTGMPQDRALGYAWLDLSAERGYQPMLIQRERYWEALTPAERASAVTRGQALYATYGDALAIRRADHAYAMAQMNSVGSRTGFVGNVKLELPDGQLLAMGLRDDPRRMTRAEYWRWIDAAWKTLRPGQVQVGAPERIDALVPSK